MSAVFKAPLAGAVFAVEVPYRDRLAGDRILPAAFGSARGYLTLAAFEGAESILDVGATDLTFGRAAGSLLLGLIVGVVARGIIALIRLAENASPSSIGRSSPTTAFPCSLAYC